MSAEGISNLLRSLDLPSPDQRDLESLFTKDKEDLLPFLDWLCSGVIGPENRLSQNELDWFVCLCLFLTQCSFRKIQSEGIHLEGDVLKVELEQARRRDDLGKEVLKTEVSILSDAVTRATTHLHRILSQKEAITASIGEQSQRQKHLKGELHRTCANHGSNASNITKTNRRLDNSLDDLFAKIKEQFALFNVTDGAPAFYHYQDKAGLAERTRSEEAFTHRLTQYVKKQFKESFVALAASGDASPFGILDVAAVHTVPAPAETSHQYQLDRQELLRLRAVDAMTTENLSAARVRLAQRSAVLQALQGVLQKCEMNRMEAMAALNRMAAAEQEQCRVLEAKFTSLWEHFHEANMQCSAMQGTSTLIGNCATKLARQHYVHEKQDALIAHLRLQRARWQLTEISLELEEQTIRKTRHLLESTLRFVRDTKSSLSDRMQAMETVRKSLELERSVVPQADHGTLALYNVLQRPDSEPRSHLITYERVVQLLQDAIKRRDSCRAQLDQKKIYKKGDLEACADVCDRLLFNDGNLSLTLPAITTQIRRLETSLNDQATGVAEFKDAITAFQEALRSDPTLRDEQRVFVAFFTNPSALPALCRKGEA